MAILLVVVAVPLALYVRVKSEDSARFTKAAGPVEVTKRAKEQVTVHAANRGRSFFNFQDGHELTVTYRGDQAAIAALQSGAQARALASADFARNGIPAVVAGYSFNGEGIITVQHGNPDAFAPKDDSVFVRMQQGYNPPSLLPSADVYKVSAPADFVATGNFSSGFHKDIVFAAKGGGLYLMKGDGSGKFGEPEQINLPGPVTALAAGEFRAADGFTDLAVGVSGTDGNSVMIFDAVDGFSNALAQYRLSDPAGAIEFGMLDDDSYMDVAVADGGEVSVFHGWGRKEQGVSAESRVERFNVGPSVRGLALGEFTWDRQGRSEIAALTSDGTLHIAQQGKLDIRPFDGPEAAQRTRGNLKAQKNTKFDAESAPSWRAAQAGGWKDAKQILGSNLSADLPKPLMRANLAGRETEEVMVLGQSQKLEILRPVGKNDPATATEQSLLVADDTAKVTMDVESAPVAVLTLPKKLNGTTDVVMLDSTSPSLNIVPNAPNTTITVDRTDDPSGASLAAASACTAVGNDCSLRGALQFANLPSNNNTTISLPANTYILSANGTSAGGCDGNAVGDLGANQTMSIVGAGAATTIIRQTGTGPANDGDRVMCMNEPFTLDLIYNFSGFTMVGGRDGTAAGTGTALGGGGIIGG
ncbi:MAG TPA: hypothetical protein VFX63_05725, partial [Pyrinomonadaceae bacterium]|nr:hypothetical protein [Pyrinomonadaceae bacterium]